MSLVEVIVFIAILSVLLVVLVGLSVNITRQSLVAQHKLYATRYADELAEWMRLQKELGWQVFYDQSQLATDMGHVYCVNQDIELTHGLRDLMLSTISSTDCMGTPWSSIGSVNPEPEIFARYVTFAPQPDNTKSVKATITVSWREPSARFDTSLETVFAPR